MIWAQRAAYEIFDKIEGNGKFLTSADIEEIIEKHYDREAFGPEPQPDGDSRELGE